MKRMSFATSWASILFLPAVLNAAIFIGGGRAWAEQSAPASKQEVQSASTEARLQAADTGYTDGAQILKNEVDRLVASAEKIPGAVFPNKAQIADLQNAATYYSRFHGTCVSAQATASGLCREKTSPHLQKSLNDINIIMGMVNGVAVKDACSTFGKAMKAAQAGLAAYTTACSTARSTCEASCATVKNNLQRIKKIQAQAFQCYAMPSSDPTGQIDAQCVALLSDAQNTFRTAVAPQVEKDVNLEDKQSIALKDKACTYEYANMILSAGMGVMSLANSIKQGASCDDQANGTGTTAQTTAEKCSIAENATLPECICLANPRTPGCANSYQKPGETSAAQVATGAGSSANVDPNRDIASFGGDSGSGIDRSENSANEGSGGGAGAPVGGGGAGLSGSSGVGGGGVAGREDAGRKGLDANILGGAGGGGGGGSWGSFGSGSGSDKYRSYLPGGDKDPNKAMAGQQAWTKEVTGQGGKSNWEKVKDRYRDNKSTLLNN